MKLLQKPLFIVLFKAFICQFAVEALYYNCSDPFLISQNCTCSITSTTRGIVSMTCNGGFLSNATQNTLPPVSTTNVPLALSISNTYTMFPTIPVSYLSLPNIDLSRNRIQAIGDLTNLANTLSFFVENNLIKELPKTALCSLTKCEVINLSNNLLETIYFEDFVCDTTKSDLNTTSNYVFSSLLQLFLAGNLIKVRVSSVV